MSMITNQSFTQPPVQSREKIPFDFQGTSVEYFKIWIVNILLTIVTLGIYSAWAKVRRKQYMYGNTSVDGSHFQYSADPVKILKGRILVVGFLFAYQFGVKAYPVLILPFMLLFAVLFPWALNKGLTFNAVYSSYKNIRFNFVATYRETFVNVGLTALLVPLTLGLAFPYFIFRMKKHIVEHSCFGQTRFKFNGDAKGFYKVYLGAFGLILVPIVAGFMAIGMSVDSGFHAFIPIVSLFFYFLAYAYIETFQTNYILNHAARAAGCPQLKRRRPP